LKTIIAGLGNPLFSDDGVGLLIARALKSQVSNTDTEIVEVTVAGLDILEIIADYDKAFIIDAVQTEQGEPGTIYRYDMNQILSFSMLNKGIPHIIDFPTSYKLSRELGLPLPGEIIIFGIEAQNTEILEEGCTPKVRAVIPICVEKIMAELT
jgi:hydrogenase maturation protease